MGYDFVDVNNEKGTFMATRQVMGLGEREVVFFGIDLDEPFERSREQGYIRAMKESRRETKLFRIANSSKKRKPGKRSFENARPASRVCLRHRPNRARGHSCGAVTRKTNSRRCGRYWK